MLNDTELLALGRKIDENYEKPFTVFGRPVTNIEMLALLAWRAEKRKESQKDGRCCNDEGPLSGGFCRRGGGMCPLFLEAEEIIKRHERTFRWQTMH